ncbi:MAG: OsmC family peroxiredoxin [Actinomycetota bacterium]|nr:OsmC family peroxiredoxin [Actinomycetota bacterium]
MADRRASALWEGNLFDGKGTVTAQSSGLFTGAEVTWASRTESSGGKTSPEELLAAAHAACFSMALSNELSSRGHVPTRVTVAAVATFDNGVITTMGLDVDAEVPDTTGDQFNEALAAAEQSCPVSNAVRDAVKITVKGSLEN